MKKSAIVVFLLTVIVSGQAGQALGANDVIASILVRNGYMEIGSSSVVDYDSSSGLVTFDNPGNRNFVVLVTDYQQGNVNYRTATHFVLSYNVNPQPDISNAQIWRTTLDTGGRNFPPQNFSAVVIVIE